jgi:uracil-DNA glycosylase
VELAQALGDDLQYEGKGKAKHLVEVTENLLSLHQKALYSSGNFSMPITVKPGVRKDMLVVSGHRWGDRKGAVLHGPRKSRAMVVGKALREPESNARRQFFGPDGELLLTTCIKVRH